MCSQANTQHLRLSHGTFLGNVVPLAAIDRLNAEAGQAQCMSKQARTAVQPTTALLPFNGSRLEPKLKQRSLPPETRMKTPNQLFGSSRASAPGLKNTWPLRYKASEAEGDAHAKWSWTMMNYGITVVMIGR